METGFRFKNSKPATIPVSEVPNCDVLRREDLGNRGRRGEDEEASEKNAKILTPHTDALLKK